MSRIDIDYQWMSCTKVCGMRSFTCSLARVQQRVFGLSECCEDATQINLGLALKWQLFSSNLLSRSHEMMIVSDNHQKCAITHIYVVVKCWCYNSCRLNHSLADCFCFLFIFIQSLLVYYFFFSFLLLVVCCLHTWTPSSLILWCRFARIIFKSANIKIIKTHAHILSLELLSHVSLFFCFESKIRKKTTKNRMDFLYVCTYIYISLATYTTYFLIVGVVVKFFFFFSILLFASEAICYCCCCFCC